MCCIDNRAHTFARIVPVDRKATTPLEEAVAAELRLFHHEIGLDAPAFVEEKEGHVAIPPGDVVGVEDRRHAAPIFFIGRRDGNTVEAAPKGGTDYRAVDSGFDARRFARRKTGKHRPDRWHGGVTLAQLR